MEWNKNRGQMLRKLLFGKLGLVFGLLILCAVFGALDSVFLTVGNIRNISIQASTNAVIAAGMTFVIISGGIDLSVGSTVALSSVIGANVMIQTENVLLGIVAALFAGVVCGLINGTIVAYLQFPPFIVTLSTMWLFRGSAYVLTGGQAVVGLPPGNMVLVQGHFFYIPYIVWLVVGVYVVCYIALAKLTIGRKIYATGDNAESARLSGINIKRVSAKMFIISGLLAALGGIILMSRLNSGQPIAGQGFELSAIAAAVIGGTSLTKGGVGGVWGTLVGALFISALLNGLIILNVDAFWQQVLMGIVVLFAVAIDKYRKIIAG